MGTLTRAFVLSLSAIAILACSGPGASDDPATVLVKATMAANVGNYSEANTYLSADALEFAKSVPFGGPRRMWDRSTKEGKLNHLEILNTDVRGEGAKVFYRSHFKDGSVKEEMRPMIKEAGKWKITIGMGNKT